jgi:transposase
MQLGHTLGVYKGTFSSRSIHFFPLEWEISQFSQFQVVLMGKKGKGRPNVRRGKNYDPEVRAYIALSNKAGRSFKSLAREHKCDPKTIKKICRKYKVTGDLKNAPGQGAPRKTTEREDRTILRRMEMDNSLTAKALAIKEAPTFLKNHVCANTIRNRLKETGKNGRVRRRKPYLREANREARLRWALDHLHWTIDDWMKVVFSDESGFHVWQEGGKLYCWRRPGEEFLDKNLQPTVKHGGGSIQVWGCFNYNAKGPLYRINGIMDGAKYKQILIHNLSPFLQDLSYENGFEPIFQHDNDPKHKSKKVKSWLDSKNYSVLDWPSQSPDLNPIEQVWRQLKLAIYARGDKAQNLDDVLRIVQEEWDKLPVEDLRHLVASMPARIDAVIKAKGGHTKY